MPNLPSEVEIKWDFQSLQILPRQAMLQKVPLKKVKKMNDVIVEHVVKNLKSA